MALLRHSGIYFLARILAGGASFAIIAAYTRLLNPHAFGELALSLAGVTFFCVLVVEGPFLAMLRYLPSHSLAARATTLWGLIVPAATVCFIAAIAIFFIAPGRWRVQLALCACLALATLLHRFQLATAQGTLKPAQYAILGSLESILDMLFGISFVLLGYGVAGALFGMTLASVVVVLVNLRCWWIGREFFDRALWRRMLRFGLPLLLSAFFGWVASFGDRWVLAAFVGADKAGLYAAAYDLPMNLLGVPFAVMMLAGYPLAISAYTDSGTEAARTQLRLLGNFIVLIMVPEAVGLVLTSPMLVNIFLGQEFRPLTLSLMPILVSALFVKTLLWHTNYGFFLGSRTDLTLLSIAAAATTDIVLDVTLIPHYGAWGAALAALIGFGVGFAIALMKMGRVFPFPLPEPAIVAAGLLGVATMTTWLLPFYHATRWTTALYVIPIAGLVYFGTVFLFLHLLGRKPLELMRGWWGGKRSKDAAI